MKNIILSCETRKKGSVNTEYTDAAEAGLEVSFGNFEDAGINDVSVSVRNTGDSDFCGIIKISVTACSDDPGFFMPGYMYGRNTAEKPSSGRKAFPRIKPDPSGMPESDFFMTRADRLAVPVSLVYEDDEVWGIAAAPYRKENDKIKFCGFSCSMQEKGKASAGYTLGYENAPWLFVQTATVLDRNIPGDEESFFLPAGGEVTFSVWIYHYKGKDEIAVYKAIEHAYSVFHESPRQIAGMTPQKAVAMLKEAIRDNAWLEDEKMYSGFVFDTPEGHTYNKIGSLTWTNGLAVVTPMLMAADRDDDEKTRTQCLAFLDKILKGAYNKASGLLYDAVDGDRWSVRGWWYDGMHSGGHSGYLNGQAVYYILKAYETEDQTRGEKHSDWLDLVRPVIAKLNSIKNTDNEYPFSMSETTGAGLEYDSMGGAWCLAATALFAAITGDKSYFEGMKLSESRYYDAYVKHAQCYGGPLDTDKAVDDEGILAYIRAVRIMHEMTDEDIYLEHMSYALRYEASFKLCYNTPVQVKPLSSVGWSSCGGSITSTANPHIHPMSSSVIGEMFYYTVHCDDPYITSVLQDTVGWSLQTFNVKDKEYDFGLSGWMSERFCFCQGLLTEKYPDGSPASTWFALMPWASASIIEGLLAAF